LLYFKSQSMKETKKVEEIHLVKRRWKRIIKYQYSTEELYLAYNNGKSVAELTKQTGLKPKTIYKRFERLRNELQEEQKYDVEYDNNDELDNNEELDKSDNFEVSSNYDEQPRNFGLGLGLLIVFPIVALVVFAFWLYEKLKAWLSNKKREQQFLIVQ